MTYEARAQALLALVEDDRATRRAAILDAARAEARIQVAHAHRRARERVLSAYHEEKHRHAAAVAEAEAALQTRLRIASQERERALLERALNRLPGALTRRWDDRTSRTAWTDAAITQALRVLPAGAWRIEHAGLAQPEITATLARLHTQGVEATFVHSERMQAGLRVVAGATTVDATLAGLLSDRDEIGARVLALLETTS